MNGLTTLPLGRVSDFEGGSQPPKSEFIAELKPGYIRLLQIRDFKSDKHAVFVRQSNKTRTCQAEDIMIGRYGASVGQIHRGKTGAYNVALIKTIPNLSIIDRDYFFHYLNSDLFQRPLSSVAERSAQAGFSKEDIYNFPVPVPPLPEQKRLVAILDEAFEGIDKAIANTDKNRANAVALLEDARELVFTEGGDDWISTTFADLCDIKHGFAFDGAHFTNSGDYVLLTPGNFFEKGGYRDRGEKQKYFVGEVPRDYIMSKGDLLVAMTEQAAGLLGSPILVPESNKFLHNQRLGLVQIKSGSNCLNEFLFHLFNARFVRNAIHASASGVKVRHTSPTKIGQVEVRIPQTISEQTIIVSRLDALVEESTGLAQRYCTKLELLSKLRQSILTKAFEGRLGTEQLISEAAE